MPEVGGGYPGLWGRGWFLRGGAQACGARCPCTQPWCGRGPEPRGPGSELGERQQLVWGRHASPALTPPGHGLAEAGLQSWSEDLNPAPLAGALGLQSGVSDLGFRAQRPG